MDILEDTDGEPILVWKQEIAEDPLWDAVVSIDGTASKVVRFREVGTVIRDDHALLEG